MRRTALGRAVLLGWVGLTLLILFAPLMTTILMSFNASELGSLPFHFSLRWYSALFANSDLLLATSISFQLAVAVTVTSALVGSMLALWLSTAKPRWALPVNGALITAVTVPWLILATSMLLLFNQLGLGRSLTSLYIGDLAVCLPYVVLVVAARLRATDPSIAQAARSLGAGQLVTFVRITLPMAAPAIVAGSLMSFIVLQQLHDAVLPCPDRCADPAHRHLHPRPRRLPPGHQRPVHHPRGRQRGAGPAAPVGQR
jgi:ABC-type spermidine/putrescine transport system permease subunit II